jgi:hypothetical protein
VQLVLLPAFDRHLLCGIDLNYTSGKAMEHFPVAAIALYKYKEMLLTQQEMPKLGSFLDTHRIRHIHQRTGRRTGSKAQLHGACSYALREPLSKVNISLFATAPTGPNRGFQYA